MYAISLSQGSHILETDSSFPDPNCRSRRHTARGGLAPGTIPRRPMEPSQRRSWVHRVCTHTHMPCATLFRGGLCVRVWWHCDVARRWPAMAEGIGPNGIAFSGGSFPYSKLLGCHSNWPGIEQSGLLRGICQRCSALCGSRVTSFFPFFYWGGEDRGHVPGTSPRKGTTPLPGRARV